jgi:putative SOS response-associated peptidase YedK
MCGRYYRRSDKQRLAEAFHLGKLPDGFVLPDWDYNVAPTTFQPVIRNARETGERELVLMRWGLVPHFAKSLTDFKEISTINAKAETLMSSNTWRVPFQSRRCPFPLTDFTRGRSWTQRTKQPYTFSMADGSAFASAGLWDGWKEPDGGWLQSYSIIMTTPNELAATVHNRMPVILELKDYNRWLERVDGERPPVDLLSRFPCDEMVTKETSKDVGNVRNDNPELLNSA